MSWKKINSVLEKQQQNIEKTTSDYISILKSTLLDIKNKVSFKTNPLAVLCFYKCNLKNKKDCKQCTELFCNNNGKIKRFDPKRLRFLLLLRDDINEFINFNLTNDSFRAFVEMDLRAKMFGNIEHSNSIYIDYTQKLISEINENSLKVGDKNNADTLKKQIQKALYLISSRYKLQKAYYNNLKMEKSFEDVLDYCEIKEAQYSSSELFDIFEGYLQNLCKYSIRISKSLEISIKNMIDDRFCNFTSYEGIFEEILFEVAFNISTHIKNQVELALDKFDSLKVTFFEIQIDNQDYIGVSNNLANMNDKLDMEIENNNSSHGLGVINKYSNLLYNKEIRCKYTPKDNDLIFSVYIPVKKV